MAMHPVQTVIICQTNSLVVSNR